MKVFVAGASGALGIPLIRQLQAHSHTVLGLVRERSHAYRLVALGVQPIVADALDRNSRSCQVERR